MSLRIFSSCLTREFVAMGLRTRERLDGVDLRDDEAFEKLSRGVLGWDMASGCLIV